MLKKYMHVYNQNCVSLSIHNKDINGGIKDIRTNQSFDSKMEEMNHIHQSYRHYDLIQEYQEYLKKNKFCHPFFLEKEHENRNGFIKTPSENYQSLYNSWKDNNINK